MTTKPITERDWRLSGTEQCTPAQRRLFNSACGDLAEQLPWHGHRMTKDSYRHLFSGVVLGALMVPSVDLGTGPVGFVMIERSSLDLNVSQATQAIEMAFYVGDEPGDQNIRAPRVDWCAVVKGARGISESDERDAERYAA